MSAHLISQEGYAFAAQEDRSAPRTRVAIPASLRASGGRSFQTVVQDLSLSGFCSMAIGRLTPGSLVWLTLPQMESMEAEVVWWDNSLVGCAFHQLLNPIIHDHVVSRWRGDGMFRPIV